MNAIESTAQQIHPQGLVHLSLVRVLIVGGAEYIGWLHASVEWTLGEPINRPETVIKGELLCIACLGVIEQNSLFLNSNTTIVVVVNLSCWKRTHTHSCFDKAHPWNIVFQQSGFCTASSRPFRTQSDYVYCFGVAFGNLKQYFSTYNQLQWLDVVLCSDVLSFGVSTALCASSYRRRTSAKVTLRSLSPSDFIQLLTSYLACSPEFLLFSSSPSADCNLFKSAAKSSLSSFLTAKPSRRR